VRYSTASEKRELKVAAGKTVVAMIVSLGLLGLTKV